MWAASALLLFTFTSNILMHRSQHHQPMQAEAEGFILQLFTQTGVEKENYPL